MPNIKSTSITIKIVSYLEKFKLETTMYKIYLRIKVCLHIVYNLLNSNMNTLQFRRYLQFYKEIKAETETKTV